MALRKAIDMLEPTTLRNRSADADLLLHVVDASSPLADEQVVEVERVLEEIGAERIPQIRVYNKLDGIPPEQRPRSMVDAIETAPGVSTPRVFVSAQDGTGLDALRQLIARQCPADARGASLPTLAAEPIQAMTR